MLRLRDLSAGYSKHQKILNGLDLDLREHEVLAVVGQNGAGKSTLAKAIMGLVPHVSGEIEFNGNNILGLTAAVINKLGVALFLQGGRTFPNLSVFENLKFASQVPSVSEGRLRAVEVLKQVGFADPSSQARLQAKASSLSGGEQHQLALAMVLLTKPELLILDEPSAGLSPANVKSLYDTLTNIRQVYVKSILLIEQNVRAAIGFSDRVNLLNEGKVALDRNCRDSASLNDIEKFFFAGNNKQGD